MRPNLQMLYKVLEFKVYVPHKVGVNDLNKLKYFFIMLI